MFTWLKTVKIRLILKKVEIFMLYNLIKKEIKELLTPSMLAVIIGITILFASMGKLIDISKEEAKKKPVVSIIDNDQSRISKKLVSIISEKTEVIYQGSQEKTGLEKVRSSEKGVAQIIITENFEKNLLAEIPGILKVDWVMRGAGIMDTISAGVLEKSFLQLEKTILINLGQKKVISEKKAAFLEKPMMKLENTYYKDKVIPALSPNKIAQVLISQSVTIPVAIMMIIMLGGSMVITSMGLEKENKTLETLLTMPIKRRTIVSGKLLGSAIVGLIMAGFYLIGFKFYMDSFQIDSQHLELLGLNLHLFDYILVGISLFASLLFGLSLAMFLGIMARDYKSAQLLTYPITALALIPMFITMYRDFDTLSLGLKALLFAIPFSHPMMAMRNLTFDNYALVIWGTLYSFVISVILIAIIVKIFNTDKLLTGILKFGKTKNIS